MRDIEFRAFTSDGMVTPYMWISKDNLPCYKLGSSPKAPLMQYTGLKDSKGVKIFEGDIIESKEYPFYGDALEFKYDELNYLGVVGIDHDGSFYELIRVSERVSGRACGSCLSDINNECYVIGNIYEHPHLIEKTESD